MQFIDTLQPTGPESCHTQPLNSQCKKVFSLEPIFIKVIVNELEVTLSCIWNDKVICAQSGLQGD